MTEKKPLRILGFYGYSASGKTTLLVKIIQRLVSEGARIAVVKQTDQSLSLDTPGKDTHQYSQAGAGLVVFSSETETDFLVRTYLEMPEIIEKLLCMGDYDFLLIEGARDPSIPKIRLGDITERENTLFTYTGDFEHLMHIIKQSKTQIWRCVNVRN